MEFDAWGKERQLAFLINAYNAFTIQLILTEYPDVASIKEDFQKAYRGINSLKEFFAGYADLLATHS